MDWKEIDPYSLRVSHPPVEAEQTEAASLVPQAAGTLPFPAAPVEAGGNAAPFVQAASSSPGSLFAPLDRQPMPPDRLLPQPDGALSAPDDPRSPAALDAASADIWQRLSLLVRTPSRADGAWSLLAPLSALPLLITLMMGEWWQTLAWGLSLTAGVKIYRVRQAGEHARDALNMAPLDLRWVGPLAQALYSPNPRVRGVAQSLLTHLLPHLRAGDAALLNARQRDYLNHKLTRNRRRDADLNKAILAAWVNVGDAETISHVERLTGAWAWSAPQQQVRETARQTLPLLERRLQEEYTARTHDAQQTQGLQTGELYAPPALSATSQAAIANVDSQLEQLREERRKHSSPGMRLGFLFASWVFIVPYTAAMAWSCFKYGPWQLGYIWAFLCLLATQLHRFSLSSRQTEAARALSHTDDIRAVGPLSEALDWPDASIKFTAATGLTRLLPGLNASDGNLLNAKQRASLYSMLRMRNVHSHYSLLEAILKALQQVGDEAAIPVVERLEKAHAYTSNQKRIKQLAHDTLPLLTASARIQGASAMLLRASSQNDAPSDLLLRGAMANNEDAPQQLLRASAGQNES